MTTSTLKIQLIKRVMATCLIVIALIITWRNISALLDLRTVTTPIEASPFGFITFMTLLLVYLIFYIVYKQITESIIQSLIKKPMKFKTHNSSDWNANLTGSHLQGYLQADYFILKELFGEPTEADGYKVDAEWEVQFEDGLIATIYNWKNGQNYNGSNGLDVEDITQWHIGGFDKEVVDRINKVYKEYVAYKQSN
jgi:hypothetical protein